MNISNSDIVATYRARTPRSAELAAEAKTLFPSGVTHDSRHLEPYSPYVTKAQGAHKWDVDDNRYVDFFGGHGALLLGHNHPEVQAAIKGALERGTHFAANHEGEIRWARAIKSMLPSAERIRFTSSGTEATTMALRLARAHTGRSKVLRFKGHFHGWGDGFSSGYSSHFDGSPVIGVSRGVADDSILIEPGDVDALKEVLETNKDIAAAILEPIGAASGREPVRPEFLRALRELTAANGVILIFDEIITGFRVTPGACQLRCGVEPDLTTLAKILAGGLPGGAVTGKLELMEWIDFAAAERTGRERFAHPGTFNANPVSAAAGATTIEIVAGSDACRRAETMAENLRGRLNEVLRTEGVPWAVYGESSMIHIFMNPRGAALGQGPFDPFAHSREDLQARPPVAARKFRLAMLANGVDPGSWPGGVLSTAHTKQDIDFTVDAFRESLNMLSREDAF